MLSDACFLTPIGFRSYDVLTLGQFGQFGHHGIFGRNGRNGSIGHFPDCLAEGTA